MKFFIIIFIFFTISCSQNKDQSLTKKIESAQQALNSSDFDKAIAILESFSNEDKVKIQVVDLLSSAYAGRAGFSSFKVYDLLDKHSNNPERALFELASNHFKTSDIEDSQKALSYIYSLSKSPDLRPSNLNLKYSTIQVYKISQILIKNINRFENTLLTDWNPCSEINLLSLDIRDILISTNRAVISVKNLQENIYNQLISIQNKYNIDPQIFEEEVVEKTDINRVRVSIGESYSEIIGASTISCDSY